MSETSENRFGLTIVVLGIVAALLWVVYSQQEGITAEIEGVTQAETDKGGSESHTPQRIPREAEDLPLPLSTRIEELPASEELHTADYGHLLQRGGADATIDLIDGRGARLCSATPPRGTLYRRSQDMWVEFDKACRFDNVRSAMEVRGGALGGLEPGDYELYLDCSPYGSKRIAFTLARGQHFQETVQLDIWREIITLKFVDYQDRPLARLGFRPLIKSASPPLKKKDRGKEPKGILKDAPGLFGQLRRGSPWASYKNRGLRPGAFLLDRGQWYMPVYVGATNTIDLGFSSKNYNQRPYVVSSTFADHVKVKRNFRLSLSKSLKTDLQRMNVQNADDVGNQSVIHDPWPLRPRNQSPRRFPRRQGRTFDLVVKNLSPTFNEFLLQIETRWGPTKNVWYGSFKTARQEQGKEVNTATIPGLSLSRTAKLNTVGIALLGANQTANSRVFYFEQHLTEQDRKDASEGKIDINLPSKTLALRLIGDDEKPLPWGEVSIIPLAEDSLSQALRQQLVDNKDALEGFQPEIQFNSVKSKTGNHPDYLEGYSVRPPSFLRGAKIRGRFGKYGTWYNSHRTGRADSDGYLFTSLVGLKTGNLYVLYIWGKSHNPQKPDRRLVFRAQAGITDLGAIAVNHFD